MLPAIGCEVKFKLFIQREDGSADSDWSITLDAIEYVVQADVIVLVLVK